MKANKHACPVTPEIPIFQDLFMVKTRKISYKNIIPFVQVSKIHQISLYRSKAPELFSRRPNLSGTHPTPENKMCEFHIFTILVLRSNGLLIPLNKRLQRPPTGLLLMPQQQLLYSSHKGLHLSAIQLSIATFFKSTDRSDGNRFQQWKS